MRSLHLFLVTLFVSVSAFAQEPSSAELFHNEHAARFAGARHFVLDPQHVLSDAERADLAQDGIAVGRPLSNGRYLARVASNAELDGHELTVRSLEPITADRKLAPSARRAAVSGHAFARVNVVFNDEVTLDEARAAIAAAGGALERPLDTEFDLPRNLRARIPSMALTQLASDERVFTIHGPSPRIAADNADEAVTARVDLVQAAPYNLNGSGVTLSYFELSPGDATHPEFGGRLITHFPAGASTSDQLHATHTAGTMIATGLTPAAKGMAPAATLHGYYVDDAGRWVNQKDRDIQTVGSVADNNSWGFILGWCNDRCTAPTGWVWTGNDEYIGGYDSTDAALDEIARTGKVLMIHSAGNEGGTTGPTVAPFPHNHQDDNGDTITGETFCYSANGSGTDCAPPCSAGPAHCEITPHPVHAAVGSIGLTASSKNVVAVGATDSARNVVNFSSKGPTRDGRVKPDITAKGFGTFSTFPNNQYGKENGTSMAAPVVTGTTALLVQQWRQSNNGADPTQAQLKGLLLAGAADVGNPGPDYVNGFGALDAKASVDIVIADGGSGKRVSTAAIAQGGSVDLPLAVSSPGALRVLLVWTDPEVVLLGDDLATSALVNDLDLVVKDPSGSSVLPYILNKDNPGANATRGVNKVDNVEEVEIANAAAGTYHVIVTGARVTANSPQSFVVVSTAGSLGSAPAPCTDLTEPNGTEAQAFGLGSGQSVTGRLCATDDVDIFKVHFDKVPGVITFTIKSDDTPLRAVLSSSTSGPITTDVAAGATVTTQQSFSNPNDYFLKITPNGALGATGNYTITASFPTTVVGRGRAARH